MGGQLDLGVAGVGLGTVGQRECLLSRELLASLLRVGHRHGGGRELSPCLSPAPSQTLGNISSPRASEYADMITRLRTGRSPFVGSKHFYRCVYEGRDYLCPAAGRFAGQGSGTTTAAPCAHACPSTCTTMCTGATTSPTTDQASPPPCTRTAPGNMYVRWLTHTHTH